MNPYELSQCVVAIYPAATSIDYTYTVDASGNAAIALWNNAVGVQPTAAQLQAALDSINLKKAQQSQITALETAYGNARYGSTVNIDTLAFPCDQATQTNLTGYLVAYADGSVPTGGVPLLDASGTPQMLTFAQLQSLAKLIAQRSVSAYQTFQSLVTNVLAATTVAAVEEIAWA